MKDQDIDSVLIKVLRDKPAEFYFRYENIPLDMLCLIKRAEYCFTCAVMLEVMTKSNIKLVETYLGMKLYPQNKY